VIQELVKPVVKVGNSAGVVLPREWLHGTAKVSLITKPLNINRDILEILEPYLEDIIGIYLVGSYARGEAIERSDVDVLVITNKTKKQIIEGKYDINLVPKELIERSLKVNILPLLPMLKESKVILNADLIKNYKSTPLTRRNLKIHIELTKSILNVNKAQITLDKEWPSPASNSVSYSLVLRLRGIYIVNCLRKNKKWSNKELLKLLERVSGSKTAYSGYLRVKDNKRMKAELPIEEAEQLYQYVYKKIREQEKWVTKKR